MFWVYFKSFVKVRYYEHSKDNWEEIGQGYSIMELE